MGEFVCFPMERGPLPDQVNTVGGWLITSWFGGRRDPITGRPGNHGGEDLAYAGCREAPFYAVKPGRVSQGWDNYGGGNWTSLFCDDGDYVGYGHAMRFAPGVNGTHVAAGTLLGWIDSTGGSTGDHMHFALNLGGQGAYDDPHDYLVRVAQRGAYPGAPAKPNAPDQAPAPIPQPDDDEDDDMPKAPRPCYAAPKGVFGVNATGKLVQLGGPDTLAKLTTPNSGSPAELQPPLEVSDTTLDTLLAFYND